MPVQDENGNGLFDLNMAPIDDFGMVDDVEAPQVVGDAMDEDGHVVENPKHIIAMSSPSEEAQPFLDLNVHAEVEVDVFIPMEDGASDD